MFIGNNKLLLRTGSLYLCNSRDLNDLVAVVYEPLNNALEIGTIKLSSGCSCKAKSAKSSSIS